MLVLNIYGYFRSVIKESVLQSKQMGRRENKSINTEGRCQFDLLLVSCVWFTIVDLLCRFCTSLLDAMNKNHSVLVWVSI